MCVYVEIDEHARKSEAIFVEFLLASPFCRFRFVRLSQQTPSPAAEPSVDCCLEIVFKEMIVGIRTRQIFRISLGLCFKSCNFKRTSVCLFHVSTVIVSLHSSKLIE